MSVQVIFKPAEVKYVDLLNAFWSYEHNLTLIMASKKGSGSKQSPHYRSGVYCATEQQMEIAARSYALLQVGDNLGLSEVHLGSTVVLKERGGREEGMSWMDLW